MAQPDAMWHNPSTALSTYHKYTVSVPAGVLQYRNTGTYLGTYSTCMQTYNSRYKFCIIHVGYKFRFTIQAFCIQKVTSNTGIYLFANCLYLYLYRIEYPTCTGAVTTRRRYNTQYILSTSTGAASVLVRIPVLSTESSCIPIPILAEPTVHIEYIGRPSMPTICKLLVRVRVLYL